MDFEDVYFPSREEAELCAEMLSRMTGDTVQARRRRQSHYNSTKWYIERWTGSLWVRN